MELHRQCGAAARAGNTAEVNRLEALIAVERKRIGG
jgi:hypothetical protein